MQLPGKTVIILAILFIISLVGSFAIYYSTYWGPWAFSDSTEYIAAARSLLAGNGLGYTAASGDFVLYSLHPPLYPLVLSLFGLIGFDLLEAARWFNIVLFGLLIFLSGAFAYSLSNSVWHAIALSIALLTIPVFVDVSSGAMSELLFLFTSGLAIGLLVLYLARRRGAFLVGSALSAALAALARYPGIVVVLTCAIGLLVANQIRWRRRLLDVLVFCLVSLTPLAVWLAWIFSQVRSIAAYKYLLPSDMGQDIMALRKSLMEIFLGWLPYRQYLPSYNYTSGRNYLVILLFGVGVLTGLIILRRLLKRPVTQGQSLASKFTFLWAIFSIGNLILLAVTFLFSSPTPDLNPRTLLPVQLGLIFFVVTLLVCVVNEFHLPRPAGFVSALLVLFFIYPNAQASWKLIDQYHQSGLGYTSSSWHSSLTLQALRELPSNTRLISNEAAAILLHLDHAAYDFCSPPCDPSGLLRYGDDLQDPIQKIFREQGAALVLFYPFCEAQNQPPDADSLAQLEDFTRGLKQAFSSCDGAIYFYPITPQNN